MRRAFRIGIFIGTLIGMSACATVQSSADRGAYGGVDVGAHR